MKVRWAFLLTQPIGWCHLIEHSTFLVARILQYASGAERTCRDNTVSVLCLLRHHHSSCRMVANGTCRYCPYHTRGFEECTKHRHLGYCCHLHHPTRTKILQGYSTYSTVPITYKDSLYSLRIQAIFVSTIQAVGYNSNCVSI